ncbi:MAG TPA: single-stranded DNA-binding protein [Candidatus Azoamicus sp. OHIO2]
MLKNSINKVFILGHIGTDPVLKYITNGTPVVKINVATNETWKDKNNNIITKTEWHKITIYNKLAEFTANFITKGTLVFIEGSLKNNTWNSDSGIKNTTEIIASSIQIINNKKTQLDKKTDVKKDDIEGNDFVPFDNKTPF